MNPSVPQRFGHADVRVGGRQIFSDHADPDAGAGMLDPLHQLRPIAQLGSRGRRLQGFDDDVAQAGVFEHQRHFIDGFGIGHRDHRPPVDVAEQGDLVFQRDTDRPLGATDDRVGLDADAAQGGDTVLGRFTLELFRCLDERHQGHMNVEDVLPTEVVLQLSDRFQEGQ